MRLILASASPRRAELLTAAGFSFETTVVEIDERPRVDERPDDYVRRLAMEKSDAAQIAGAGSVRFQPDRDEVRLRADATVVLAADTAVVIDGEILGKPVDEEDARRMMRRLSGNTHEVLTGISLRHRSGEIGSIERTRVTFALMGDEEVEWYVQTGEGRDKAGAYAVQGLAMRFVTRIEGSYSNVVGLPVQAVYRLLLSLHPTGSRAILR